MGEERKSTGPVLSLPVAAVRLGLSYQTTYAAALGVVFWAMWVAKAS